MRERIRLVMENEHLTPSAFADMLQIGRAVMSHILNGRNNPSLDVVTRILEKLPKINPDWLLTGNGIMYKSTLEADTNNYNSTEINSVSTKSPDLFAENIINHVVPETKDEYRKEIIVDTSVNYSKVADNNDVTYPKSEAKKIMKIIIYYSDNTFETFDANNRPF